MRDLAQLRRLRSRPAAILCFVALLAAALAALYAIGAPHYKADLRARVAEALADPGAVRVAVFGNSHSGCVQLGVMGWSGVKLGEGGQDMFEVAHKIARLAPRLPALETVLVSMSYHSFFYDNAAYSKGGVNTREGKRIDMYAQLPFSPTWIPGDFDSWLKGVLSPIITEDHWKGILEGQRPAATAGMSPDDEGATPKSLADVRAAAAKYAGKNTRASLAKSAAAESRLFEAVIANMAARSPDIPARALRAALEFSGALERRGVRVVFFTPPYSRDYVARCDPAMKAQMYAAMERIVAETGAEYLDFSRDPEFADATNVFLNSDHLNLIGARLFSVRLEERLEETGAARR